MKVAFVCGPYRADTDRGVIENIRTAEYVAVALWKIGFAVICPHLNSAHFSGVTDEGNFLAGYKELVHRSDVLVRCQNCDGSVGSLAEIQVALTEKIPVCNWPRDKHILTDFAATGIFPE